MHVRPTALLLVLSLPACYDKPEPQGSGTVVDTGGASTGDENGTSSATNPTTTLSGTTSAESSTGASVTSDADSSTSASAGSSSDDAADSTAGPFVPTICDQAPTTLAACVGSSKDQLNQGTLACDPAVMFTAFFEDVWTVDVAAGDCIYANVDNISDAGPTGAPAGDVALHMRSPSGAYAWADDEVACQDATWTGGACPEATLAADVAGTWEISVVQASGTGCTSGAPYILYVAINGVATIVTQATDDVRTDC
ncbi:MAG: hypothetical protein IAG13_07690 [Deltaproteobacteria bacterium]|nr:hypothetical protein [Nannocystaceae bacterium]